MAEVDPKKVSTQIPAAGLTDPTDNDPPDEGLAIIAAKGYPDEKQGPTFYNYANSVRRGKVIKFIVQLVVSQLPFIIYLLLSYLVK